MYEGFVGLKRERLVEAGDGFAHSLQGGERTATIDPGGRMLRLQRERAIEALDCVLLSAKTDQRVGAQCQGRTEAWVEGQRFAADFQRLVEAAERIEDFGVVREGLRLRFIDLQ